MNDNEPSVLMNRPDPDFQQPVPPPPLEGEVKIGASDPDAGDAPSIAANAPEPPPPPPDEPPQGEVAAGANTPGVLPPSVMGTSQGEAAPENAPPQKHHERKRGGLFKSSEE